MTRHLNTLQAWAFAVVLGTVLWVALIVAAWHAFGWVGVR